MNFENVTETFGFMSESLAGIFGRRARRRRRVFAQDDIVLLETSQFNRNIVHVADILVMEISASMLLAPIFPAATVVVPGLQEPSSSSVPGSRISLTTGQFLCIQNTSSLLESAGLTRNIANNSRTICANVFRLKGERCGFCYREPVSWCFAGPRPCVFQPRRM